MAFSFRVFFRQGPRFGVYRINVDGVRSTDFVTISASEAFASAEFPGRFIGGARPVIIGSVAAHNGYIEFSPWWTLTNVAYLDLWVDVTVLQQ